MSYNVNAMNAYQQYGSSMAAGGGGTNMSGSGAKQGLGTKPSDAYKQYAETMTAGGGGQTMAGTGTSAYQQAQERAGRDRDEKPNSPAKLYQNSANAFTNAGVNLKDQTWTPSADPRLIYNENKFKTEKIVTDVKDYLRGTAIQDALLEAQGFEAPRSALYTGEDRPLTEQELQQYKPLFDLMDDSIEVEELSRMDREDQEALLESIGVGNLGRMPRDTAFLGGDFDVATTSQEFIRDAVRAKQIADELEKLSKEVDPNSPLQAEMQKLLEQVQGEENETAPVVRPEMYEDMSTPVSPTDTITDDADGGAAPSGKGLMSPDAGMLRPRARPLKNPIYSSAINNLYTEVGKVETTEHHLGKADYTKQGITLAYGIVPDSGLKYNHNGKVIDLPANDKKGSVWKALTKAGVTTSNFNPDNVITIGAQKDGIYRSEYVSDEAFTKAVLVKFEEDLKEEMKKEGVDYDSIPEKVKGGLVSYTWNAGSHKYKSMEPAFKEVIKASPDMKVIQKGMLQTYTESGIVIRGLVARRAIDYNLVAEGLNKPTITSYTPVKLRNGNAGIKFTFSDGSSLTDDTGKNYETKTSKAAFKDYLNKEVKIS